MRENFSRLNLCVFWTAWWPRPSPNSMSALFCGRTIAKTICQRARTMPNGLVGGLLAPGSRIIYNLSGNKVVCASATVAFTQFSSRLTSHAFLSSRISAIYMPRVLLLPGAWGAWGSFGPGIITQSSFFLVTHSNINFYMLTGPGGNSCGPGQKHNCAVQAARLANWNVEKALNAHMKNGERKLHFPSARSRHL